MSRPTEEEILGEIEKLKGMVDKVIPSSMFGDDNVAAIKAQIKVLEERLTEDQIYDDDDLEPYAQDSAINALNWMNGDEEDSPSFGWLDLVEE